MAEYEHTRLWQQSLAPRRNDAFAEQRERLRASYTVLRTQCGLLAAMIPEDHPEFTVHDLTHLDGLWALADLIAGSEITLTPPEAYVLGGAFLLHDLGMSLAAYPEGVDQLRSKPIWTATLVSALKRELSRRPTEAEVLSPPLHVEKQVLGTVLRLLHAEQAERLALQPWIDEDGTQHFLIHDPELRRKYGGHIGGIAHSHWWSIEQLKTEFAGPALGSVPLLNQPPEWTVDRIKLACLLRMADATHLDSRRAPHFLRVLRRPQGVAANHWIFQEKLTFPQRIGDELVFTAAIPFPESEAQAWWLCYDALSAADQEIGSCFRLLRDTASLHISVRGIKHAGNPSEIAELIRPVGWIPVDTTIRVSAVADLVRKLGGEQLYGPDLSIPLRELVQNAADAVRLRRVVSRFDPDWGSVVIRSGHDDTGDWIEVQDSGIGMSPQVLTGALLDFGSSYWGSDLMLSEFPEAVTAGYEAAGKFGIGFFSTFMWGERIRLISRRYKEAERDTHKLTFHDGPHQRPVLSKATPAEYLPEGGTRIRVWMRSENEATLGIVRSAKIGAISWIRFCARFFATLDCNLFVETASVKLAPVVRANDWLTVSPEELLLRLWAKDPGDYDSFQREIIQRIGADMQYLYSNDGDVIGRACLVDGTTLRGFGVPRETPGLITIGGLLAASVHNFAGVLTGVPTTASRRDAVIKVGRESAREWATDQALRVAARLSNSPEELQELATIVWQMGGDTGPLPIAVSIRGQETHASLSTWADAPHSFLISGRLTIAGLKEICRDLHIHENVLMTTFTGTVIPTGLSTSRYENGGGQHLSHAAPALDALAKAWGVPVESLHRQAMGPERRREIGERNGSPVFEHMVEISRHLVEQTR